MDVKISVKSSGNVDRGGKKGSDCNTVPQHVHVVSQGESARKVRDKSDYMLASGRKDAHTIKFKVK